MMSTNDERESKNNDGDDSMRHGFISDGMVDCNEVKSNDDGDVDRDDVKLETSTEVPSNDALTSSAVNAENNGTDQLGAPAQTESEAQINQPICSTSTETNASLVNTSQSSLTVSLPSTTQQGTSMISPPTPYIKQDEAAMQEVTSSMLFLSNPSSVTKIKHDDVGLNQPLVEQRLNDSSNEEMAGTNDPSSPQPVVQDSVKTDTLVSMDTDAAKSVVYSESAVNQSTCSRVNENEYTLQSQEVLPQVSHDSSNVNQDATSAPSSSITSYLPMSSSIHASAPATQIIPTSQSYSSIIPTYPSHERRGSGFLLLAAEAMERNESRENAIRRAAMELTAASADGGIVNDTSATAAAAAAAPVVNMTPNQTAYSTRLQRVFEMPSLHADQLSSTSPATIQQPQQPMTWSTTSSVASSTVAPLIQPKPPPVKERTKSKPEGPDLLPSGRPRPPPQKHVYHDYASVPDSTAGGEPSPSRKKTGGVTSPFPEKLMHMLDQETMKHPDVVGWLPHGRAFLVRKPKVFTSEIMPIYFRQSKLTSFQRQLNLYGFRRITQGADGGAYYHELFLRGRPSLCARMVRQKVKGTGHKQPTDIASEPNFYAMPTVLPLPRSQNDAASVLHPSPPMMEQNSQEYNALMNSPGIQAATLLKRLSSVGTPSQFSLDEVNPPPLVPGTGAVPIYSFDSFLSESSTSVPLTTLDVREASGGKTEEDDRVEHAAEV